MTTWELLIFLNRCPKDCDIVINYPYFDGEEKYIAQAKMSDIFYDKEENVVKLSMEEA